MIKQFDNLSDAEKKLLVRAPVLVSVLACCSDKHVNKIRKHDAIKLAHLRTFTSPPELQEYYHNVDRIFESEFEATVNQYYPFDDERMSALIDLIQAVHQVINKLPVDFGNALNASLGSYIRHVRNSDHGLLRNIIFPMAFAKLGDDETGLTGYRHSG